MAEKKPDLIIPKNFINWALYGLSGTIAAVSITAYVDVRKRLDRCEETNNYYARTSFDNAMIIRNQEKTIKVLDTVITETKAYISDSIKAVNVKNFKGPLNIKEK